MHLHDGSQLAERRDAFLHYLPKRMDVIERRLHRFQQSGWDINGISLIHDETRRLGESSLRYELEGTGEPLLSMATLVKDILIHEVLPTPTLSNQLWSLIETINTAIRRAQAPPSDIVAGPHPVAIAQPPPLPTPFLDDTASTLTIELTESALHHTGTPSVAPIISETTPIPLAPGRIAKPSVSVNVPTAPTEDLYQLTLAPGYRLYHLTSHDPLSIELDRRLEAQGVEVELLQDANELKELLRALPAHLVLVDSSFSAQLEDIGETVRQTRERINRRLLLVAISQADNIAMHLSARRAGVDALVVEPKNANDVLKRLQALVGAEREEPFRILIVEDDRNQALFAQGILRNAGMDSLVVLEPLNVMATLEQFQPDLILMDLHMPHANGIELTALIREKEAFMDIPIVFLSGESDEDRQFDAIDAGGDDFLAKPIRPRHLISALQNRVRRHRTIEKRRNKPLGKDLTIGLLDRGEFLEQLNTYMASLAPARQGGILFLEIENLNQLRKRLDSHMLEQLLDEVSHLLATIVGDLPVTRFSDNSYLVLDNLRDDVALEALALQVRNTLMQHTFQIKNHSLRLRLSIGVCAFKHSFNETNALLSAVQKVAHQARMNKRCVLRYEPPIATEEQNPATLQIKSPEENNHSDLELLYQPVVTLAGGDDAQYQVLPHMRDINGQLVPAAEMIPLHERTDLIVERDRWVMMQTLALIQDQRAQASALRLFVAQSALTLADNSQAAWLKAELVRHTVPGSALVIELHPEDVAMHIVAVRQFCDAMISTGVQFCLNQYDIGTGVDTLLEQLPLSFVKLSCKYSDDSLMSNLRGELRALIENAHRRGFEVIGQDIKDKQSAATLWMSGIDFIQGNLVRPVSHELDFDFTQAVL